MGQTLLLEDGKAIFVDRACADIVSTSRRHGRRGKIRFDKRRYGRPGPPQKKGRGARGSRDETIEPGIPFPNPWAKPDAAGYEPSGAAGTWARNRPATPARASDTGGRPCLPTRGQWVSDYCMMGLASFSTLRKRPRGPSQGDAVLPMSSGFDSRQKRMAIGVASPRIAFFHL